MKTMRKVALTLFMMTLVAGISFAANDSVSHDVTINVAEVAMIGLNSTATITLTTGDPASAGGDPTGNSNTTKTVQYTSITDGVTTRALQGSLGVGDAAPAGTSLTLDVAGGTGAQTLVDCPAVNLLTGIASTATGGTGPAMTYAIAIGTVANLVVGATSTVTVTITLTDY